MMAQMGTLSNLPPGNQDYPWNQQHHQLPIEYYHQPHTTKIFRNIAGESNEIANFVVLPFLQPTSSFSSSTSSEEGGQVESVSVYNTAPAYSAVAGYGNFDILPSMPAVLKSTSFEIGDNYKSMSALPPLKVEQSVSSFSYRVAVAQPTSNYHSERIKKQQAMLAGGGSLFATSPRSFLMGRKKAPTYCSE